MGDSSSSPLSSPSSSSSPYLNQNQTHSLMATTITDLNSDSLAHCASYLNFQDVCNLAMTCNYLKGVAYSDSIWQRFFTERWRQPLSSSSFPSSGWREMYLARRTALQQFKFTDPFVSEFFMDARPFNHLLLDKNDIFLTQGSLIQKINLDSYQHGTDILLTLSDHKARITCMRILVNVALKATMAQYCPYQINYWGRVAAKYWQVEEKMALSGFGPLPQVANEVSKL